jgi:hypothetical protein
MRLRNTLILALLLLGLGAYLYFVEREQIAEESKKDKLVEVDVDSIEAVTLTYPDRELALEKRDGAWHVTKPVATRADDVSVKNLLRAIADAEVTKTIDDPPADLAPFGLAPPAATVVVTAKGQALAPIKVGKTTAVSNSTYVQRADEPKILLTGAALHTTVDKQPKDLRDKKIVEFKDEDITHIALRGPQGSVALAKQDGGWNIVQPAAYKADPNAVRALLSTVRNLRATDFANDAPSRDDLAAYGLADPERELVLRAGDRGPAVTLLLGQERDDGLYVKSGEKPTVFVVGKWVAADLSKDVNALRDKTVLSFDPAAVTAIEVARGDGEQFTLTRGETAWTLAGVEGAANADAVEVFVDALSRLNGNEILAESATDLAQFGLERPAITVTVTGKEGAALGTVRVGMRAPNPPATEYTAKRDDDPTIFQLRDFQYDQIDKRKPDFAPAAPVATPPA